MKAAPPSINYVDDPVDLVHACNVTSKLFWITRYSGKSLAVQTALTKMKLGDRALTEIKEISSAIQSKVKSEFERETFVRNFLELIEVYRSEVPRHPIWATNWSQFKSVADIDLPGYWLESVGIPCPEDSEWIILFRYPASEVSKLYRPTQLEAEILLTISLHP